MITKFNLVMEKSETHYSDTLFSQVTTPKEAYDFSKVVGLHKQSQEVLGMFALNTQHEIIGYFELSRGNLSSSIVSPREIFKRLLLANASSYILLHNHPSGDVTPSPADIEVTHQLKRISSTIEIPLIDHIIVSFDSFFSFTEADII
jgi:DNA repair protein RadC